MWTDDILPDHPETILTIEDLTTGALNNTQPRKRF